MREGVVSKTTRNLNDPVWEFSEKHLYVGAIWAAIWHLGETVGIMDSEFHGVWTPSVTCYVSKSCHFPKLPSLCWELQIKMLTFGIVSPREDQDIRDKTINIAQVCGHKVTSYQIKDCKDSSWTQE